jgi:acetyl-CoA decarbonylase/synthase complex subunit gamma
VALPRLQQPFVTGALNTPVGQVPQVVSTLAWRDYAGMYKVRWNIGRMSHTVAPGLYALGTPEAASPVLVSANYKFSFDLLRAALPGRNAWILVLDTKGINVWCAAGKGTFGTQELLTRLAASRVGEVVSHRELILPQLGAPGVAAHEVKKASGFRVRYGPIRACDLPRYLDAGCQATPEMRGKTFTLRERAAVIPVELVHAGKAALLLLPALFLLGGINRHAAFWQHACNHGIWAGIALLAAIVTGSCLVPLLLPVLPGRAFSSKGFSLGLAVALLLIWLRQGTLYWPPDMWEALAWLCAVPALTAYLAMNFTGCSTYTSLSGVKQEMRWALPCQIVGTAAGLVVWLIARFVS